MEARRKEILRKTTVVSRTPHTLVSVDLQTYLQDKMSFLSSLKTYFLLGGSREIHLKKLQQQENVMRGRGTTISHKTPNLTTID